MHVIAIHSISDPQTFWDAAENSEIPDGVTLHSALPNGDGTRAVCVWEADTVDRVRETVEGTVGEVSTNEYFEVNADNAQGLPG
jgi:hypothetical protein